MIDKLLRLPAVGNGGTAYDVLINTKYILRVLPFAITQPPGAKVPDVTIIEQAQTAPQMQASAQGALVTTVIQLPFDEVATRLGMGSDG